MSETFIRTLQRAAFDGVAFPVDDVSMESNIARAEHTTWRRDGADHEILRREPYRCRLTIPLINVDSIVRQYGTVYPDLYRTLVDRFERVRVSAFVHPVRGEFRALVGPWTDTFSGKQRNGVVVSATFTEQLSGAEFGTPNSMVFELEEVLMDAAEAADTAMGTVGASEALGWTSTAAVYTAQLPLVADVTASLQTTQAAFAAMRTVVTANLGLAAFAVASAHSATAALEYLQSVTRSYERRVLARFYAARVYVTPQRMSVWEVAAAVYRDESKARLIEAVNTLVDRLVVPAGTTLYVPQDT